MNFKKIAILGSGQGGLACAADMVLLGGCEVNLFARSNPGKSLKAVQKAGGIHIIRGGEKKYAKLNKITSNIEEAIEGVDLIMPVVPSYGHKYLAELLAPHVKDGTTIILNPGSTGGVLEFLKVFKDKGVTANFNLAETNTLPYAVRHAGPATVNVLLDAENLMFSAFPAEKTDIMLEAFRKLYPTTVKSQNILEVALNNGNPISHPAAAILNAGRIEYTKGDYYHYKEGITPSIARMLEALDRERLAICKVIGVKGIPTSERLTTLGYTEPGENLYEQYHTSEFFAPIKAPENLDGRFITEDVPYGLVTWCTLADTICVEVPLMRSLVHIASALQGVDYFKEGRSMENLGLKDMSLEELKQFVTIGAIKAVS
ncbi:MAG: NAD/NADP octopine/nopaline dehydrogenase family protein [Clostridiaceae bacterium]|nr:NAD/NADP octopine/nopaline dehydrogenase family protein [Clostridiaceae bacterium]